MPKYCTVEDVKNQLPENMVIESGDSMPTFGAGSRQGDNLSMEMIEYYIEQASEYVDSAIGTIYDTPLKPVNRGGKIGYPRPIPFIVALLAAQLVYEKELQGSDKQSSDIAKDKKKQGMDMLKLVQNGELSLAGIRNTRGSRYVSGTLYDASHNPAKDNKSEGI